MQLRANRSWWLLGAGVLLGAGAAYAANPAYDEAKANITKASALLAAITPAANEKRAEAMQRKRALGALERAKIRIACAQAIADGGKPGCPQANARLEDSDAEEQKEREKEERKEKEEQKEKEAKQKKEREKSKAPQ